MIYSKEKEKYQDELFEAENDIAMSGQLQSKKQAVDMFEKMISPEYQEQKKLEKHRNQFIKKKTISVGL